MSHYLAVNELGRFDIDVIRPKLFTLTYFLFIRLHDLHQTNRDHDISNAAEIEKSTNGDRLGAARANACRHMCAGDL